MVQVLWLENKAMTLMPIVFLFFFKQKTAYEIVSRDWSSDVCSSDLTDIINRYCPYKTYKTRANKLDYVNSTPNL